MLIRSKNSVIQVSFRVSSFYATCLKLGKSKYKSFENPYSIVVGRWDVDKSKNGRIVE